MKLIFIVNLRMERELKAAKEAEQRRREDARREAAVGQLSDRIARM